MLTALLLVAAQLPPLPGGGTDIPTSQIPRPARAAIDGWIACFARSIAESSMFGSDAPAPTVDAAFAGCSAQEARIRPALQRRYTPAEADAIVLHLQHGLRERALKDVAAFRTPRRPPAADR